MSPRDGRWFKFKRSLRRVFESLFVCAVKKGRRCDSRNSARGNARSRWTQKRRFCAHQLLHERKTDYTPRFRGFNGAELDVVSVNERKKSLLSFKCQITFYPKRCITKRLLLKLFRRGRARPQGTTKNGRSIDAFFCRRGRWFRRRRRCRRWWCLFGRNHVLLCRIRIRLRVLRRRFRRSSPFLFWRRFRCIARR